MTLNNKFKVEDVDLQMKDLKSNLNNYIRCAILEKSLQYPQKRIYFEIQNDIIL